MNLFDYLLIAIVGLSTVLSLWRGFVREALSLIGLVISFFVASRASGMAAGALAEWIPNQTAANVAGFVLAFVAAMVVMAFIGSLIRKVVDMVDLTATDRTLGMLFGLARGLLLIGLFFLIFTSYVKDDPSWMKDSRLAPYAKQLGDMLGRVIPEGYPFSRQGGHPTVPDIPLKDKKALENIIRNHMQ